MKTVVKILGILLIVGGLNWGLIGLFDFNLVEVIFGSIPVLEQIIYIVVGVAAAVELFRAFKK